MAGAAGVDPSRLREAIASRTSGGAAVHTGNVELGAKVKLGPIG